MQVMLPIQFHWIWFELFILTRLDRFNANRKTSILRIKLRQNLLIFKGVSVKSGGRHGCPCWQNKNGRDEEDTQKIIENVKKKHAKNKAYAKNGVGFTVSAFLERQILA